MKKIIIVIMFCSFMLHAQTPADMKITLQDIEQLEQQYATLKNEHLRETTTFRVMKIHWDTKVPALQLFLFSFSLIFSFPGVAD